VVSELPASDEQLNLREPRSVTDNEGTTCPIK